MHLVHLDSEVKVNENGNLKIQYADLSLDHVNLLVDNNSTIEFGSYTFGVLTYILNSVQITVGPRARLSLGVVHTQTDRNSITEVTSRKQHRGEKSLDLTFSWRTKHLISDLKYKQN